MKQAQKTKNAGTQVDRARAVILGLVALAALLPGCADDGPKQWSAGARPTYEDRDVQPATLDEVKGSSSTRVWGSGKSTTVR